MIVSVNKHTCDEATSKAKKVNAQINLDIQK